MRITVVVGVLMCLASSLMAFLMNPWLQLLLMVMLLLFCVMFITNFLAICLTWRSRGRRALIPFGLSVLFSLLLIPAIGFGIKARLMKFHYQKPDYEAVISLIEREQIRVEASLGPIVVPDSYKHLAYAVLGSRDPNGVLTIEFLTGRGFPVKHSGFLYRSDDNATRWEHISRWPRLERIDTNWYRIGD